MGRATLSCLLACFFAAAEPQDLRTESRRWGPPQKLSLVTGMKLGALWGAGSTVREVSALVAMIGSPGAAGASGHGS